MTHSNQNIPDLVSESRNAATTNLDSLSALELAAAMNREDKKVADAVEASLPDIAQAIDAIAAALRQGGRLFYVGAGTSGRLGVLDAAECIPTFSAKPDQVIGIIAGGEQALTSPIEGAEDNRAQGQIDLSQYTPTKHDVVVGIAASGRTPYVLGALKYANTLGCTTVCVVCNPNSDMANSVDIPIAVVVGPECLSGSTRLKAGSAQKMVLNILSTGAFVKIGKVYQNLMVDLKATNQKLQIRAINIIKTLTDCSDELAQQWLDAAQGNVKVAVAMGMLGSDAQTAMTLLETAHGRLGKVLSSE